MRPEAGGGAAGRTAGRALGVDVAELVSLSAAIAAADGGAVEAQAERALAAGAPPGAVYETILQSYLFVGFPRAIEAFFAARGALGRAGFDAGAARATGGADAGTDARAGADGAGGADSDLAAWRRDGEDLCRRVYGRNYDKLVATMQGLSPDLGRWMILEGYGKTLSRPGLDAPTREYAVLAILTVTRMWRQLRSHAIGAVNVGGTREGVREAIARSGPYAGAEAVAEALRVAGL